MRNPTQKCESEQVYFSMTHKNGRTTCRLMDFFDVYGRIMEYF